MKKIFILLCLLLSVSYACSQAWEELKHDSGDSTGLYYSTMGDNLTLFITAGTLTGGREVQEKKEPYFFLGVVRNPALDIDTYLPFYRTSSGNLEIVDKVRFEGGNIKKTLDFKKAESVSSVEEFSVEEFYEFTRGVTNFLMSLSKELALKAIITTKDEKTYTYLLGPYEVERLYDLGIIYSASGGPLRKPKAKSGDKMPYVYQIDPWKR